ncbi:MAG: UTP--glucose-1-phosphate uridylyltransferase [Verrucomicrobia bacterium]|nr:UTP--glucose-1-phosphate uridylyltransferase [Verrucomicrobiota bacterium]MCH8525904.1 UTP--glucose-1-phosphate uridylyltransferase [Kiritimatiellia bacterium]
MHIERAVITAAGPGQRGIPLQTLVDRDGVTRSALAVLLREIQDAGIRKTAVVIRPGDEEAYTEAAGVLAEGLTFLPQVEARGYGHALSLAKTFTQGESFLHLVGDHLCVSDEAAGCARQLVDVARSEACAVSAVQATRETTLSLYGAVGGLKVPGSERLYRVECVREKPTPTVAERELVVPGLRAAHYLCFFGMHVLTPGVMEALEARLAAAEGSGVNLSSALDDLSRREKYLALEIKGHRHNLGVPYGLFHAQLALALRGVDRDQVLADMVTLLAQRGGGVA